jgi:hypothetical protein
LEIYAKNRALTSLLRLLRLLRAGGRDAVYWGCCTKMGADPDPFIRSQILRDASGFFGGLD